MLRSLFVVAGLAAGVLFSDSSAQAQIIFGGGGRVPGGGFQSAEIRPGRYYGLPGGTNINPYTGSVYRPWAGTVSKWSGDYHYVPGTGTYTPWGKVPGTGVYQNPWTGNQYNPNSGAYIRRWGW